MTLPLTTIDFITTKIIFCEEKKILLDKDLTLLYGVETKVLKQAVRRNLNRFPDDFMFELTNEEFSNLRSQFVTSSWSGQRSSIRIHGAGCSDFRYS
jgi:hypothetical protein